MVKIEKTPTPPPSLAVEREKANGSYNKEDVLTQLEADFHGKCYICEIKNGLVPMQVEHLLPHHQRSIPERVFDWNNLFYACSHCNSLKNAQRYEGHIINCCVTDPEELLEHIFQEKQVVVKPLSNSAYMTAELIQRSFQESEPYGRKRESYARFAELQKTMHKLFRNLDKHSADISAQRPRAVLRTLLGREAQFAAFTRHYVRSHLSDYPELKDYVV